MELRQLQYAVRLATEKNFTRAAEKLHIAQSSLSQQIAKMEKELGLRLFERTTGSVELTYAGTRFVQQAQKILDMVDQLYKEMEDISQMRKGKLVIGSLPMTGTHILPLVLPLFQQSYPHIEIVLVEDTTANLELFAAQGRTDLSLLSLPLLDQSLECLPLLEEEICLAVPPGHPLAGRYKNAPVPMDRLRDEPFILLKKGQGFRQIVLDLFRQAGFEPRIVFESGNIETIQSLVAAGMGMAFVPEMITRSRHSRLAPAFLHLENRPTRQLVIARKHGRYLSRAAGAFIETMQTAVRRAKAERLL